jgi:Fur family peroxide stress response transcriptional regulator
MAAPQPGFRMTRQRRLVYNVLLRDLDHPTASEVFLRAKDELAGISLATVYNCLETLTDAGLVKQVNIDREPSRYCPNLHNHAHFFCMSCGAVEDVAPAADDGGLCGWRIPEGNRVDKLEVAMRGICKRCAESATSSSGPVKCGSSASV